MRPTERLTNCRIPNNATLQNTPISPGTRQFDTDAAPQLCSISSKGPRVLFLLVPFVRLVLKVRIPIIDTIETFV